MGKELHPLIWDPAAQREGVAVKVWMGKNGRRGEEGASAKARISLGLCVEGEERRHRKAFRKREKE